MWAEKRLQKAEGVGVEARASPPTTAVHSSPLHEAISCQTSDIHLKHSTITPRHIRPSTYLLSPPLTMAGLCRHTKKFWNRPHSCTRKKENRKIQNYEGRKEEVKRLSENESRNVYVICVEWIISSLPSTDNHLISSILMALKFYIRLYRSTYT